MAAKKIVTFTFVPTQGKPVSKEVSWKKGMTAGQVAEAAGYGSEQLDFTLVGGSVIDVTSVVKAGLTIKGSERPRGS